MPSTTDAGRELAEELERIGRSDLLTKVIDAEKQAIEQSLLVSLERIATALEAMAATTP